MKAELEQIRDRLEELQEEAADKGDDGRRSLEWDDVTFYIWRSVRELNDAISAFNYMEHD